ncbi:MAG: glycosyltransferase [Clostridiales Family XIII bacterium]|jgi:glycosyltransferase involved in cell wall biosynthesis|nr:glycosyltransferase [Clostridiales Family XIII bacterium]
MGILDISIIIPTYKKNRWLDKAIFSCLNQKGNYGIEILVAVNGNDEEYYKRLEKQYENEKRVRVLYTKKQGVAAARNMAVKVSQGEWISFLDDDDYLTDGFLKSLMESVKKDKKIIVGKIYNEDIKSKKIEKDSGIISAILGFKPEKISKSKDIPLNILEKLAVEKTEISLYKIRKNYKIFFPENLKYFMVILYTVTYKLYKRDFFLKLQPFREDVISGTDTLFGNENIDKIFNANFFISNIKNNEAYIRRETKNSISNRNIKNLLLLSGKNFNTNYPNIEKIILDRLVLNKYAYNIYISAKKNLEKAFAARTIVAGFIKCNALINRLSKKNHAILIEKIKKKNFPEIFYKRLNLKIKIFNFRRYFFWQYIVRLKRKLKR